MNGYFNCTDKFIRYLISLMNPVRLHILIYNIDVNNNNNNNIATELLFNMNIRKN